MKTLFTFLLSGLVTLSALAADVTGRVTVSFTGNKQYRVLVDGRHYGGTDRIYLNDLRPGRHTIEVYPAQSNRGRRTQAIQTVNFTLRPNYDLHIKVQPDGYLKFNEKRINDRKGRDDRDRRDRDDRYSRDRDERDWRDRDRTGEGYNDYSRAMSEADFNTFVQRIRSQWFGKISTAREGIAANYFTTVQVRQVLQLFSPEKDRLELAKLSYRRVVDPRSFTQLYDLFSTSGRDDLDRYIRDNRY